jgi:hypothetical protein
VVSVKKGQSPQFFCPDSVVESGTRASSSCIKLGSIDYFLAAM